MRRPLWSGTLSFGIVSIPVRMYPAIREHTVHFHQVSREGYKRIRYKKVAEGTDREVASDEIVKGYELPDGRYVIFDDDELAKLSAKRSRSIDISDFVKLDEIDPRHFDQPYYLLPEEEGAKPYRLLVEALARSGLVGIAQLVLHNKEHLVAVRSLAGVLCLETMRFRDEIVDPEQLDDSAPARRARVAERELTMAERLIASMTSRFDPAAYRDEHTARIKDAIARKSRGKTVAVEEEPVEAEGGKVIDLMEALRRSLERTQRGRGAPTRRHAGAARSRSRGKARARQRAG